MSNSTIATNGVSIGSVNVATPKGDKKPLTALHTLQMVAMGLIVPSKTNPRKFFDDAALKELADSIKDHGVLQPLLLRPLTEKGQTKYEIVDGERRWRASKLAEQTEVPANVRELSDKDVAEMQIVANLLRKDLTPLEEADGFARLVRELGYKPAEVADRIHKSPTYVLRHLKLADLNPKLRNLIDVGTLPVGHGLLLGRIPDHALQMQAYEKIQTTDWYEGSRVAVLIPLKQATNIVSREYMLDLTKVAFDLSDKVLVPAAGSCADCQYRSGNARDLFDDVKSKDICTKPPCYHAKVTAWFKKLEGVKLPSADVNVVFHLHGDVKSNSGYVDIEKKPDGSAKTIEKIVNGEVPTVLALDLGGGLRKLAKADAVNKILRREKVGSAAHAPNPWRKTKTKAQREKEEQAKLTERVELRVAQSVVKQIGAGIEKVADSNYYQSVLLLFEHGFGFDRDGFLKSQGITKARSDGAWGKWVLSLKRTQYRAKLFELMMFTVYNDYARSTAGSSKKLFDEICVLCKIDDAALRREATAALAPKSKGAPKGKSKSKAKKGVKA